MKVRPRNAPRRRGFTLLEVLLVVAILVALAAFAVPNLLGTQEGSQKNVAKLRVTEITQSVMKYKIDTGNFPTSLTDLKVKPNPPPSNYSSTGYDDKVEQPDPWGSPYNYRIPGTKNSAGKPDVWSNGPDRQSETADDIGNWQ
jgi:general secretion pathway protein G